MQLASGCVGNFWGCVATNALLFTVRPLLWCKEPCSNQKYVIERCMNYRIESTKSHLLTRCVGLVEVPRFFLFSPTLIFFGLMVLDFSSFFGWFFQGQRPNHFSEACLGFAGPPFWHIVPLGVNWQTLGQQEV